MGNGEMRIIMACLVVMVSGSGELWRIVFDIWWW
jgi:hypothetical protein